MSANAFGSDWSQMEAGTCGSGNYKMGDLPFRNLLNHKRRYRLGQLQWRIAAQSIDVLR